MTKSETSRAQDAAVRCAVVLACLLAWRVLAAVPVPGLAPDAVARQVRGYRLRDISLAYSGVRPLVDMMLLPFMLSAVSQRVRDVLGDFESVRYQALLAALVLVVAGSDGRRLASSLRDSGQLGSASVDPYAVVGAVLAGSALVLGIGWVLAVYGLRSAPVRGWLLLYAADFLDRWQNRWSSAWNRLSPHELVAVWPLAVQAAALLADAALVLVVITAVRVIRLRVPVEVGRGRPRLREHRLELHILRGSPLFAAVLPSALALAISDFFGTVTGRALVDPAFSLLLFVLAIASGVFLERLNFDPDWVAMNLHNHGITIVGVPRGPTTRLFLRKRLWLLAAIAVPAYALSLSAPQLVELLVPSPARVQLYGVQIALVTVIIYGAFRALRKQFVPHPSGIRPRYGQTTERLNTE